jgi:ribonuclease P protein component
MLSRKYRLPVKNFPKTARTVYGDFFCNIKALKNEMDYNRFAVIIPARAVKGAVNRNKLKRAIFDISAEHLGGKNDILWVFKKSPDGPISQTKEVVSEIYKKIKI